MYKLFPVNPTLSHLIGAFIDTLATDSRDHIYGLLGMLPPNSHATKTEVDYRKTVEEVFQRNMEYLIAEEDTSEPWKSTSVEPTLRLPTTPSWVPFWHREMFARFLLGGLRDLLPITYPDSPRRSFIEGDILTVYGLIFDSIETVTENISPKNLKSIVLSQVNYHLSTNITESVEVEEAARRTLLTMDTEKKGLIPQNHERDQEFFYYFASWVLESRGLSSDIVRENPRLNNLAESSRIFREAYPEECKTDMNIQDLTSSDKSPQWLFDQVEKGPGSEKSVTASLFDPQLNLGRNIFRGVEGFSGVGPAGRNDNPADTKPAVQVGDCLAIVDRGLTPVVLRPRDDGMYTLVGLSHVGNIAPFLAIRPFLEFVPLRIR
jgi:hypothetical protein